MGRHGRSPGLTARYDPLLLATSILGLVWNLCALPAYELLKVGIGGPFLYMAAIGFSALGLLPAVVVHSVLRGERHGLRGFGRRAVAAAAYVSATIAALLHLHAVWLGQPVPSPAGMRLLTYTFVALIVPLARLTRGQPGARRALWAAALATFAVSALHLSQFHQGDASWPVELVGHHASLPLALAILYQDYPFALADLFLKRALALLALVAVAFVGIVWFDVGAAGTVAVHRDPRHVGLLITLWVATALVYPFVRRKVAWFVDSVILRRPDYRSLRTAVTREIQAAETVQAVLSGACALLGPALSSTGVTWREWRRPFAEEPLVRAGQDAVDATRAHAPASLHDGQTAAELTAALVIVPTAEPPRFAIAISRLTGGRRLLSDDLATLEAIAITVARRVDAVRMTDERYEREIREQEISKLATEAELRALRAQVNPHFLFNALTTIAYLIQVAPPRALRTLMRLTSLLRAVLRSESDTTTVGREIELVEAYLDIERERFEERLRVSIDVPARLRGLPIPPLVMQPLVENAVKHGIAPLSAGGEVRISARLDTTAAHLGQLVLIVEDTGAGTSAGSLEQGRLAGVGLGNVERRLVCQYGAEASLSIRSAPGEGTTVELRMPAAATALAYPTGRKAAM